MRGLVSSWGRAAKAAPSLLPASARSKKNMLLLRRGLVARRQKAASGLRVAAGGVARAAARARGRGAPRGFS